MHVIANAEARANLGTRFVGATEHAFRLHVEHGMEERLFVIRIESGEIEGRRFLFFLFVLFWLGNRNRRRRDCVLCCSKLLL